jgi:hypothetical protein
MDFLIGFAGAFTLLLLTGGSFLLGWMAQDKYAKKHYSSSADSPDMVTRQMLKEQQQAFTEMQNYSVETAYRMKDTPTPEE